MLSDELKLVTVHGGEYSVGKRKTARPFSSKKPIHMTMRSSWASGEYSLRRPEHQKFIRELVEELSEKWHVKVYELSINSNHLHFLIRGKTRLGFQNFLRVLAGQVASFVTRAKKGIALKKRFWDLPAFTRLLEWRKSFQTVKRYILQNILEAAGIIPYQNRTHAGASAPGSSRTNRPAEKHKTPLGGRLGLPR